MKFTQPAADAFVPDNAPLGDAFARTTHLCIGAHQDDIEIMAYHGIAECHGHADRGFTGIVVTDGAGSPRSGKFARCTDEQMKHIRADEQRAAARLGGYAAMIQLAHPSAQVKDTNFHGVVDDLAAIVARVSPRVVYLHNPADKHDTHIAVLLRSLAALRALPADKQPSQVYGCEVWRDLDWLDDEHKIALDVSAHPHLATQLVAAFESQIAGGKRYDLATAGRRLAHATFHTAHATDKAHALTWAMDLTPLVRNPQLSIEQFTLAHVDRFRADVAVKLARFASPSSRKL